MGQHNETAAQRPALCVYATRVRVSDQLAVKALLAPIPNAKQLRPLLKSDCIAQQWEPDQKIDFWFFSNGRIVVRLWIEGLTEQQAGRSRALFAERARLAGYGRIAWVKEILRDVVTNSPPSTTH